MLLMTPRGNCAQFNYAVAIRRTFERAPSVGHVHRSPPRRAFSIRRRIMRGSRSIAIDRFHLDPSPLAMSSTRVLCKALRIILVARLGTYRFDAEQTGTRTRVPGSPLRDFRLSTRWSARMIRISRGAIDRGVCWTRGSLFFSESSAGAWKIWQCAETLYCIVELPEIHKLHSNASSIKSKWN